MRSVKQYFSIFKKVFVSRLKRIIRYFRSIKIQPRLITFFIIVSIIPLFISAILSNSETRNAIHTKISTYSQQIMSQIAGNIERELVRLENDSIEIEFSSTVQNLLTNIDSMSEWEIENVQILLQDTLVKKFSTLHDVSDVLIFTNNNRKIVAYGDKGGFALNFKQPFLDNYLNVLVKAEGAPVWISSNEEVEERYVTFATSPEQMNKSDCILLGRAVVALKNSDIIGKLIIRTNERYFSNVYKHADIGTGSDIFVIDSNGIIVSSRNKDIPVAMPYKDSSLIRKLNLSREETDTFDLTIENNQYLVAYSYIPKSEWYVVSTIPYSYLNSEAEKIRERILILSLVCLFVSVLLSYLFSLSISMPLKSLVRAMNQVKSGNLSVELRDDSTDEIGEVSGNFKIMVKEIQSLLEDVKYTEHQKRIAEIKTLQAQINPHFLSNTLNTVKWLAKAQKADNIENLVSSLIQLLHVSMGKGGDFITVREEIEYLKSYINIQEYRYYDKFNVLFEIDEEVLDYKILKFILQPVIENSIIHGIDTMVEKGLIVVKAYIYNSNLVIIVTDNGIGISKEKIESILKNTSKSSFSSIGIYNVNERIKLNFGEQYGLNIQSVEGLYTTVEITLPIIKEI